MPKKRTLADLYAVGRKVVFDDGRGEPVSVFLRKLTPVQIEEVARNARASKAAVTTLKRLPLDDPARIEYLGDISDFLGNKEFLVQYLVQDRLARIRQAKEAEVQSREKWDEDDYLQSIYDAWETGGMKERYHLNNEDAEPARIFADLKLFGEEVDKELEGYERDFHKDFEGKTVDELATIVADKTMDLEGDIRYLNEFRRSEIFMGTYDEEDHRVKYFETRAEVDALPIEVLQRFFDEFSQLNVDSLEGKDSEEAPSS